MTFTIPVLSLLLIIALVGGILALIDGIAQVRGHAAILGIVQIIVAALFILSLFFAGIPFGAILLAFVLVLLLILGLAFRSTARGSVWLPLIALILLIVWLVLGPHNIVIPGINA
ncbi:MAG: hypothetical protein ABIS08_11365 [Pseudolysinimonas sp.]